MSTPISFSNDGGTPARRLRHQRAPAPRLPLWRFTFAALALPLLLPIIAVAAWLAWMCLQGAVGTPGAVIALTGMGAVAARIRRRTGGIWQALTFLAAVALVTLVWVVLALVALALAVGG